MSSSKQNIFLASRFEEFKILRQYLNVELSEYFDVIDLNDGKAVSHSALQRSLLEVQNCDLMILLLGDTYSENVLTEEQLSITHLEYREARKKEYSKEVLVFCIGNMYANNDIVFSEHEKLRQFQNEVLNSNNGLVASLFHKGDETEIAKSIVRNVISHMVTKYKTPGIDREVVLMEDVIQSLQNNVDMSFLRNTALKYMPRNYIRTIPKDFDSIINELVAYGETEEHIPLVCVLSELLKTIYLKELENYLEYLKKEKYPHATYECVENSQLSERSFILHFLPENGQFKVEMWEHYNQEFTKRELFLSKERIEINTEDIQLLFNSFNAYIDANADYHIYLELVLPIEELAKGIHTWKYVTGRRKREKKIISRYKCILRIQERFIEYKHAWGEKWKALAQERSLLDNEHIVLSEGYNGEISGDRQCVLSQSKIDEIEDVLDDIDDNKISIAILPLRECNDSSQLYAEIWETPVAYSKERMCKMILQDHSYDHTDILFLFDDPNKIPEQLKEPDNHKYGY
jgi:hypothetical protein